MTCLIQTWRTPDSCVLIVFTVVEPSPDMKTLAYVGFSSHTLYVVHKDITAPFSIVSIVVSYSTPAEKVCKGVYSEEQIRRIFDDHFGIIFHISPYKRRIIIMWARRF